MKTRKSTIGLLAGLTLTFGAGLLSAGTPVSAQEPIEMYKQGDPVKGAALFQRICSACHTIGGGVRVGPDLAGVHKRHERDWLQKFIPSSTKMIASGDPAAVALFEKFNKVLMPDQVFTVKQVDSILAFIESRGGDASAPRVIDMTKPAKGNANTGAALFDGRRRLASGGPACNSCHGLNHETVMGGGVLSKDLTKAYSRLGGDGVAAILSNPPFPLMKRAFQDHPINSTEALALIAFLWEADVEAPLVPGRDWGWLLFIGGAVGAAILLALLGFLWRGRKSTLVNQKIFDRQMGTLGASD